MQVHGSPADGVAYEGATVLEAKQARDWPCVCFKPQAPFTQQCYRVLWKLRRELVCANGGCQAEQPSLAERCMGVAACTSATTSYYACATLSWKQAAGMLKSKLQQRG